MKRVFTTATWLTVALFLIALPAFSQESPTTTLAGVPNVDVADLLAEMDLWDEQRISITGELVGDYSYRSSGVWVQINDDAFVRAPVGAGGTPTSGNTGLGALVPTEAFDSSALGPPGRNGRYGPVVQAVGVFHRNDPALSGETYLEVEKIIILQVAEAYSVPGPDIWLYVGVVLLALAGVVAFRSRPS